MNSMQAIAASVPHDYRQKILLEWLPNATASMANPNMVLLFEAWFNYVEPNGLRNSNCPKCIMNILENWQQLAPYLAEEEKENNLLKAL